MKRRFHKSTTAIIALGCAATPLQAAELGFYVAGFYGEATRTDVEQGPFDAVALGVYQILAFEPLETVAAALGDDADAGFGMVAGYRFTPHLAIEGGYVDLGEISYRNTSFGNDLAEEQQENGSVNLSVAASGFTLSALGILPLSYRWELYARGGVLIGTNEIEFSASEFLPRTSGSASESSTDWLVGAGASFTFAEVYSARLEYQRVIGAEGFDGVGESDIDLLTIGFAVSF